RSPTCASSTSSAPSPASCAWRATRLPEDGAEYRAGLRPASAAVCLWGLSLGARWLVGLPDGVHRLTRIPDPTSVEDVMSAVADAAAEAGSSVTRDAAPPERATPRGFRRTPERGVEELRWAGEGWTAAGEP